MLQVVSRYREIADDLRSAIINGRAVGGKELTRGAQLPTYTELEGLYNVSRETVRRAVAELQAEGLVATRGRDGMVVRNPAVLPHPVHVAPFFTEWSERAKEIGAPSTDFDMRIVPAPVSIAFRLGIEPEMMIVVRRQLRRIDGIPWSLEESSYPLDIAQKAGLDSPRDIPDGTMVALERAGLPETRWRVETSARFATADEQSLLAMGAGAALLICIDTAYSGDVVVRDTIEFLPADRNVILEHYPLSGR
ncbi:GntR family transcriptional regulator [Microlunatus parietis]|uniref:GntR family transcriptional regulator n=1 Tax=Microlunatus parietis TaxID=682979 RepID=A0A7Y9I473_9ACTN|nr:GntR family transcriptional regulator [Microlunatus parietis]NYE69937.1 GntR family transcriptional regulator [Microlunatus parietis]